MNQSIVNKITNYFSNQPIEKAWVFGSFARSEETNESDIDIIVNFLPGSRISLFQYIHIINELKAITNKNIDMVENGQLKQFAVNSADVDKILIYERKTQR